MSTTLIEIRSYAKTARSAGLVFFLPSSKAGSGVKFRHSRVCEAGRRECGACRSIFLFSCSFLPDVPGSPPVSRGAGAVHRDGKLQYQPHASKPHEQHRVDGGPEPVCHHACPGQRHHQPQRRGAVHARIHRNGAGVRDGASQSQHRAFGKQSGGGDGGVALPIGGQHSRRLRHPGALTAIFHAPSPLVAASLRFL
jgi:hypothetical protein